MKFVPHQMLITDGSLHENTTKKLAHIEQHCKAALHAVMLREKKTKTHQLYEIALELKKMTQRHGTLLIVNERTDVALAIQADGIHLPENAVCPRIVRKLAPNMLIGASIHCIEIAKQREQEGVDYLLCGPIYSTQNKQGFGPAFLQNVKRQTPIPLIAVGGLNANNIHHCKKAGAYGIAAMTLFWNGYND
jgi:thiamine-phosphate pyrophosphorylase